MKWNRIGRAIVWVSEKAEGGEVVSEPRWELAGKVGSGGEVTRI
jgi:hypothetical protein